MGVSMCDCVCSWQPVTDFIEQRYEEFLNAEMCVNRKAVPDNRVHCCLYFISPNGHGYVIICVLADGCLVSQLMKFTSMVLLVCVIFHLELQCFILLKYDFRWVVVK